MLFPIGRRMVNSGLFFGGHPPFKWIYTVGVIEHINQILTANARLLRNSKKFQGIRVRGHNFENNYNKTDVLLWTVWPGRWYFHRLYPSTLDLADIHKA